jgi:hypothetical protein
VPQCRSCGAQATITHIQRHFEQPMMSFHSHLPEAPGLCRNGSLDLASVHQVHKQGQGVSGFQIFPWHKRGNTGRPWRERTDTTDVGF